MITDALRPGREPAAKTEPGARPPPPALVEASRVGGGSAGGGGVGDSDAASWPHPLRRAAPARQDAAIMIDAV